MAEKKEDVREWAALPGQVLQHVFQDDPSTALRRPARAVCSPWRAAINAHVQQAYCDVGDVPLLRGFTGLRSVTIDEVDLLGRFMCQIQQRNWAIPQQQQPVVPGDPLQPSAALIQISSGRSRRRRRRMPGAQHLDVFGPRYLDLAPLQQLPGLQDVTLRCIHLIKRLPLHTVHLVHVTSLTLHQKHSFGRQRVDDLPTALLPLRKLRRLVLIGIREKSAAKLLEPVYQDGWSVMPLLAEMLMDYAHRGGFQGSSHSWQQQGQGQEQQEEHGPKPRGVSALEQLAQVLEEEARKGRHTGSSSGQQQKGQQQQQQQQEEQQQQQAAARLAGASSPTAAAVAAAAAETPGAGPSSSSRPAPPARRLPCPWLGKLHCLVLRSCCLNSLPAAALVSLTAVTSLDLSNNYLELLPPALRTLKQLQVLLLDNNNYMHRAHQLPWSGLTALTHLSLSSCANLMGRRLQLSQLVGLQRLGAADNDRAPVGASLEGCTALKVLDVRGTRIGSSLSGALIDGLPALQRCLYGPRRGGKWVRAVRRAAVVSGVEMVRDPGWVGTYEEDQDFWGPRDWVDQEASSSSSEEEKEDEEEGGSMSEEGSEGEGSEGADTEPSTESGATYASEDSALDSDEEEGEDSGSWDEGGDEMQE